MPPRPGSAAARSGDSSPGALIRAWYEAFVADTLHNYPGVDELPANFTDFDYVWSSFQTSNRKLRGTVVELTDFERDTVLEYLRDQLRVLDFDNANDTIVWHADRLEVVNDETPTMSRRPWSQATHDWGAAASIIPKDRPAVDELFWDDAPTIGAVDPAWKIDWAGEPTPSQAAADSRSSSRASTSSSQVSRSREVKAPPPSKLVVDDAKRRAQKQDHRRPMPRLSSGAVEAPPQKKRPAKTESGKQAKAWATPMPQASVKAAKPKADRPKDAVKPVAKPDKAPVNKAAASDADEAPKCKDESSAKTGSGMALLGFDYL